MCLFRTSFHFHAPKASLLEAPLCATISVWKSLSYDCKFTVTRRSVLSVVECDHLLVLLQWHSRTVQFGCIVVLIGGGCWSRFPTFPVWQTRRTGSLSSLGSAGERAPVSLKMYCVSAEVCPAVFSTQAEIIRGRLETARFYNCGLRW